MADYIASALLAAQANIATQFTEAEMRERQNPILRVGLANQNYLLTDIESIKKSTKRPVKGYQFTRRAASNGTTRSHNFTGTQGDTTEVTLNWNTFSEPFSLYLKAGADNVKSNAQMMEDSMRQVQRILRERIGAALVTNLHAGRTQTSNAIVRNGVFNPATDAFEIASADQFFAYAKSIMTQHKYYGNLDIMVDSVLNPIARKIAAQGTNNGENQAYSLQGFSDVMTHDILGTEVAVAGYENGGVAIVLPQYSFAFIPFVEQVYRDGGIGGSFTDYNGAYSTMRDETGLPLTYMLRGYSQRADGSANGGTADDILTNFQVSCDVATQISEVSAANESPVYEFALTP